MYFRVLERREKRSDTFCFNSCRYVTSEAVLAFPSGDAQQVRNGWKSHYKLSSRQRSLIVGNLSTGYRHGVAGKWDEKDLIRIFFFFEKLKKSENIFKHGLEAWKLFWRFNICKSAVNHFWDLCNGPIFYVFFFLTFQLILALFFVLVSVLEFSFLKLYHKKYSAFMFSLRYAIFGLSMYI